MGKAILMTFERKTNPEKLVPSFICGENSNQQGSREERGHRPSCPKGRRQTKWGTKRESN